ncbi:MAG: hypothetical protein GY714_12705, partial [Desulfobacterales bacterium]|nr:hypothetical protein [Desulfobacterales bacterium]
MKETELHKFNIIKHNDKDIEIESYLHVSKDHYLQAGLFISPKTIPELLKIITNKKAIKYCNIQDVIDNGHDNIEFAFRGSEQKPIFTILNNGHKMLNGDVDSGIIDIPLD